MFLFIYGEVGQDGEAATVLTYTHTHMARTTVLRAGGIPLHALHGYHLSCTLQSGRQPNMHICMLAYIYGLFRVCPGMSQGRHGYGQTTPF